MSFSPGACDLQSHMARMFQVEWHKGSAFDNDILKSVTSNATAVVHTLGILLESDYKSNGLSSLASGMLKGFRQSRLREEEDANPLRTHKSPLHANGSKEGKYELINRDSALSVLRAYLESSPPGSSPSPNETPENPFIYISAEDVFRPFVPPRYISTKREAERRIQRMSDTARSMSSLSGREGSQGNDFEGLERPSRTVRPVYIRPSESSLRNKGGEAAWDGADVLHIPSPGLIYDPATRPASAIPAAFLNMSASVQSILPPLMRASTHGSILSSFSPRRSTSPFYRPSAAYDNSTTGENNIPPAAESLGNLLSIPPIHVDTVAEAVCRSIERRNVRGVVGVEEMRELVKETSERTELRWA